MRNSIAAALAVALCFGLSPARARAGELPYYDSLAPGQAAVEWVEIVESGGLRQARGRLLPDAEDTTAPPELLLFYGDLCHATGDRAAAADAYTRALRGLVDEYLPPAAVYRALARAAQRDGDSLRAAVWATQAWLRDPDDESSRKLATRSLSRRPFEPLDEVGLAGVAALLHEVARSQVALLALTGGVFPEAGPGLTVLGRTVPYGYDLGEVRRPAPGERQGLLARRIQQVMSQRLALNPEPSPALLRLLAEPGQRITVTFEPKRITVLLDAGSGATSPLRVQLRTDLPVAFEQADALLAAQLYRPGRPTALDDDPTGARWAERPGETLIYVHPDLGGVNSRSGGETRWLEQLHRLGWGARGLPDATPALSEVVLRNVPVVLAVRSSTAGCATTDTDPFSPRASDVTPASSPELLVACLAGEQEVPGYWYHPYLAAAALHRMGRWDEAVDALVRAGTLAPAGPAARRIHRARTWMLGTSGRTEELRRHLEELDTTDPEGLAGSVVVLDRLPAAGMSQAEVAGWYRRAAEQVADQACALRLSAGSIAVEANLDLGEADLRLALEVACPAGVRRAASEQLVDLHVARGQPDLARSELKKRDRWDSGSFSARSRREVELARDLIEAGHPGPASEICAELLGAPKLARVGREGLKRCVDVMDRADQGAAAEELLRERLGDELRGTGETLLESLAGLRERRGAVADAVAAWRDFGPIHSEPARVHREIAALLSRAGRHREAVAEARLAVEVAGDVPARLQLAASLQEAGQLEAAVAEYASLSGAPKARSHRRPISEGLNRAAVACAGPLGWARCKHVLSGFGAGEAPGTCAIVEGTADRLMRRGRAADGAVVLRSLSEVCGPSELDAETSLDVLTHAGLLDEALEWTSGLDVLPEAPTDLATALRIASRPGDGDALLVRWAAEKADDVRRLRPLARYRLRTGDSAGVHDAARQALNLNPGLRWASSMLAEQHRLAGEFDERVELLRSGLEEELTPRERAAVTLDLARALHEAGRTEEAVDSAADLLMKLGEVGRPREVRHLLRSTADLLVSLGRPVVALEACRQAPWLTSPERDLTLARLLAQAGRVEEGMELLRHLPSRFPEDQRAARTAADVARRWGPTELAELLLREAIARDPADEATRRDLHRLLVGQGRVDEAAVVVAEGGAHGPTFLLSVDVPEVRLVGDPSRPLVLAGLALQVVGTEGIHSLAGADPEEMSRDERRGLLRLWIQHLIESGDLGEPVAADLGDLAGRGDLPATLVAGGDLLRERGDLRRAEDWYQAALDLVPSDRTAAAGLERLLVSTDRVDEAEELVDATFHDRTVDRLVHSGRFAALLEQAGHCTEAVSRFRGVVDHLDSPGFRHDLAYLLRGMGRTDEGEALLRADTRHASRAASLAGFLLDDQRPAEALEVLGPLVARMPWDLALYPVHGDTLSRLGRHDDARETMERLLRLRPDPAKRALFALYLRRSGDLEAAEREARDVLSRDASSSHALEVLGEVALRREDVPAALEAFRVAFEANPKRSGTGFRAVVLLRREGRAAEADAVLASLLEALEQRMEDHPCDPLSGLSYATALATFAPERAREGLSIAREAHRRRPGQRTHAVLARVLHVLGRSKQAVEHARAAADAETEPSAGAAYLLARALAEAGDDEQAREALARGVELDPNYFDRPEIEAEVLGPAHDRKPSSVE